MPRAAGLIPWILVEAVTMSEGEAWRCGFGHTCSVSGAGRYGGVTVPAFPFTPGRRGRTGSRFPASRASWRFVGRRSGSGPCPGGRGGSVP